MANQTVSTSQTLEAVIAGGLNNGQNITINGGAVITMTETNSVLIGRITINEGVFLIDGTSISTGNSISFIGEGGDPAVDETMTINGQGTFEVTGQWFDVGTTDGTDSQVIDLSLAGGIDLWNGDNYISWLSMIQIETGRRIDYDTDTGLAPAVGDWVNLVSNTSVMGKVHSVGAGFLVLWYLTGSFVDNDAIEIVKVVDNFGPDMQVSWTASVNNVLGDIKEVGVYQEFGNSRSGGTSFISAFHHGVGGFVFDHVYQDTFITLGSSLGTTGGFRPPNGCNIRVPNVMMGSANSAAFDAGNTSIQAGDDERDWHQMEFTAGGTIKLNIVNLGNYLAQDASAFLYEANYVGATVCIGSNNSANRQIYSHVVTIQDPVNNSLPAIRYSPSIQDCANGADISFCMMLNSRVNRCHIGCETSIGVDVSDCIATSAGQGTQLSSATNQNFRFNRSANITCSNCVAVGSDNINQDELLVVQQTPSVTITDFMYCCTQDETPQTVESNTMNINAQSGGSIVGIKQIGAGVTGNFLANVSDLSSWKFRCFGMIDRKVEFTSDAEVCIDVRGLSSDLDFARMWKDGEASATEEFIQIPTTAKNITVSNCSGAYGSELQPSGNGGIRFKGVHGGSGNYGEATGWEDAFLGSYGNSFHDGFQSDTNGTIACLMITPSTNEDETNIIAGTPRFFKDGDLDVTNGDIIEFTQGYYSLGHTGFTGNFTAAVGTATLFQDEWSGVTIDFQFDVNDGGGFNGTWLDARTSANLTGIVVSASLGVKIKLRLTSTVTRNNMSAFLLETTTSLNDQRNNFYPIDQQTVPLVLTVTDHLGAAIENARVEVSAAATGGGVTSGDVILTGLTSALGTINLAEFSYISDVPIKIKARQGSVSPYKVPSTSAGTISSLGFSVTIALQPDE